MKRVLLLIGGALLFACSLAQATPLTGNDLLQLAKADRRAAFNYIIGFMDAVSIVKELPGIQSPKPLIGICVPSNATYSQAFDIVLKAIQDDPANRHIDAMALAYVALDKAWPCPR